MINSVEFNKSKQIIIAGNPNVGKTCIFNNLTGKDEKIANYACVTSDVKSGSCFDNFGIKHTAYDLPGTYGISAYTKEEQKVFDLLYQSDDSTRLIYVLDARNLERNLFFGTQILEFKIPVCFVIMFSEQAKRQGIWIGEKALCEKIGVPIVVLNEHVSNRKRQLKEIVTNDNFGINSKFSIEFPSEGLRFIKNLKKSTHFDESLCSLLLLQTSKQRSKITKTKEGFFAKTVHKLNSEVEGWQINYIAARYAWIEEVLKKCQKHIDCRKIKFFNFDTILLNKIAGPIFAFLIFFSMLSFVFVISEYPMNLCEKFIYNLQLWINNNFSDTWFRCMISEGVIGGAGNVLLFLPQFILIIGCLSVLENIGYMARIMFMVEWLMKKIGLSGNSFIALVSCYACAIPGIMQTRCLKNRTERLTTLFVAPWVNCVSRIPIYLIIISLIFDSIAPFKKTFIVIAIYAVGLISALILAGIIRKFFHEKTYEISIAEMPQLIRPQWSYIFRIMLNHCLFFLKKVGTVVLLFSIILWCLLNTKVQSKTKDCQNIDCVHFIANKFEKLLTPIGFNSNIGIAIISSFAARENFVSTLGVLYNVDAKSSKYLRYKLKNAIDENGKPVYSLATCVSLILFLMFSLQCIGTIASIKAETNSWRLSLMQFIFMNSFAYLLCFIVYKILSK